jgi:signal transduction histidine kinase
METDKERSANEPLDSESGKSVDNEKLAELRRLSEYRSLMLGTLAHDLRTPLTAILGFAEILIDFEKLTDSQRVLCERIQNSGRELQNTINLVSDLSRLDLDDNVIAWREVSLPATLQELEGAFARKLQQKKVTLEWSVADAVTTLPSDQSRLRQLLYNLLAFAITRSPREGTIQIGAVPNGDREVAISIEDEGDPVDLGQDLEVAGALLAGDTAALHGIGLQVSRRLAQSLGGTITFASENSRGLSIVLVLPSEPIGGL